MNLDDFTIQNESLVLNILTLVDAHDVYEAMCKSLSKLREFPASLPWAVNEPNIESTRAFCRSAIENLLKKETFTYSVRHKDLKFFVGLMDIHKISWEENHAEIGFWGNIHQQKNGYMTSALNLFIQHLFKNSGFKQLYAYVDQENTAARNLCQRVGFDLEEIQQNSAQNPVDGSLRNICKYKIENNK